MLLSDKCIQPMKTQTHTITIDTASLSSMKRSCISAMDGTPRANTLSIKNTINNQTPPPCNYYGQSNSHNYYSSEVRSPEPYQMSHQNNQYNTINTRHSYPTVQNNENEYNLPLRNGHGIVEQSLNYDNWINSKEQFKISNQIIEAIKEKHLGNWLKPLR